MTEHANDGYNAPTSPTGPGPRNASAVLDQAHAEQAAAASAESGQPDGGSDEVTLKDLQAEAANLNIEGRSSMNKEELQKAIEQAKAAPAA